MGTNEINKDKLVVQVLTEAVNRLLANRDFMGLQLEYAYGNITKFDFDCRSGKYLREPEAKSDIAVAVELQILWENLGTELDTEIMSLLIGCPISQIEEVLNIEGVRRCLK